MQITYLKKLSIYLLVTFCMTVLYVELSRLWVASGGGSSTNWKFEYPFVATMLVVFYFSKIQNKYIQHVFPVLPILVIYLLFDIFYSFLGRSPRPSDLQNFVTIFDFSPEMGIGLLLLISLIPLSIGLLIYCAYKGSAFNKFMFMLTYKSLILSIAIFYLSTDTFANYQKKTFNYVTFSHERTIRKNGRFANFLFNHRKEKEHYLTLQSYMNDNIDIHITLYPGSIIQKRNIHIIVLESFIDPRMLENIQFDRSPLSEEIKPYLREEENFSFVHSPVYGGGSAQAEFEILTGIKAYAKVESVEFNVMKGGRVNGFINRLRQNGYKTTATVATGSNYFNSKQAYKSLGFDTVVFLEDEGVEKIDGDSRIFDGDLFEYNFAKIKNMLSKKNDKPILNYVLGMYGHFPYERNEKKRPSIIEIDHKDKRIQRIVDQFYYRTKALGNYIGTLINLDPNCIIYVTSDHLPPVFGNGIDYKRNKHINISILLKEGKFVDVSGKKYYEIPWVIWDLLREKESKRNIKNEDMEKMYLKALSESISKT